MHLIADLHIHSRYSRATSRSLDFIALYRTALEKGINLVGTGDFTHPGWLAEIEAQLEPAEQGLFRLKPELERRAREGLPAACTDAPVRFVLQVEISNIYKKAERVRKNHNLVFVPSIDAAKRFNERLASIGNITSDGRPILGLDARDLLEITLETDPLAFLIPAHIWTPWFSMFGSKSGFDSVLECFGDLSPHIFAAETGLSSDPLMNWRVSALDRLTLISNSDAHSAEKLGREANLLDIELGYEPLFRALRDRQGFLGTLEFYPEEGKYHLDGHRKCNVRLDPEETRKLEGRCPVCGGPLTVGVMSRVQDLADRESGARPEGATPYESLVPLEEAVCEALGVGPGSDRVRSLRARLLNMLGPELKILREVPLEEITRAGGPLVAEAVRRIRTGELAISAGYDGEYGTVHIFGPDDHRQLAGQASLFGATAGPAKRTRAVKAASRERGEGADADAIPEALSVAGAGPASAEAMRSLAERPSPSGLEDPLLGLDESQRRAAETVDGPLLIVAGPGSGKTRTLVSRIAHLVHTGRVAPAQVLAISFTNQAAEELKERILRMVPGARPEAPLVTTFHGLGLRILTQDGQPAPQIVAEEEEREALVATAAGPETPARELKRLRSRISLAKQSPDPAPVLGDDERLRDVFQRYQALLRERGAVDLDDLVWMAYHRLEQAPLLAAQLAERFRCVSVDEFQDVNDVQAALVRLLAPDGRALCVIGDPNQAIYGFRGSRPGHFTRFTRTYPDAKVVPLELTYRLTRQTLAVASSVLAASDRLHATTEGLRVEVVACPTPASEAEQIVVRLEQIVGGTSYFAVDSGRGENPELSGVGFGDVAILSRTRIQQRELIEALGRAGVPYRQVGEDEPHDPRSQKVAIMTMHAAKGREFEVVFVTGVEEGLMPLELEGFDTDPTEERRLLYVALTRAKRLTVVSHAARRMLFGRPLPGNPSPFIRDLPAGMIRRIAPAMPPKRPEDRQLTLF